MYRNQRHDWTININNLETIIENNFCKSLSYQDWWLNGGRSFLEDFYQEAEHVEREVRVQVVQVFDHAPESFNSRNVCLLLHLGKFY
jgi:hypothetical protein